MGRGAGREQKLCDVTGRVGTNGRPGGRECIAIGRGAAAREWEGATRGAKWLRSDREGGRRGGRRAAK